MRLRAFNVAPCRKHKSAVTVRIQDRGHEPEVTELRGFRIRERPTYCVTISGTYNSANYERISMRFCAFNSAPHREQNSMIWV